MQRWLGMARCRPGRQPRIARQSARAEEGPREAQQAGQPGARAGRQEGRRERRQAGRREGLGTARHGRLLADDAGTAALEFALTLPLLALLLLGSADFALTAARARELEALVDSAAKAVRRAAAQELPPLRGWAGLQQGGLTSLPPLPGLSLETLVTLPPDVAPKLRLFRGCAAPSGIVPTAALRCPDGSPPPAFAEIEITAPVARLVAWPGGLFPPTVSARSIVRLD